MTTPVFKRWRYWLHLSGALLAKYWAILGIGLILGCLTFFLSPYVAKFLPKFRGTSTIAVVGRFTPTDIPLFIQRQISSGLTSVDPNGLATPAIASAWSVSDGGKTYTFEINPNLKWQDGTALKSQDINYQFRDTTTDYPDATHLVMKLKDPYAPLPVVVSRPVFKRGLLGTGSYKVSRIHKNGSYLESLTMTPIDKTSHQPNLTYRFYSSEEAARLAFKLGEVRSILDLQDAAGLADLPNARIEVEPHSDRYVAVFFNLRDSSFKGQAGKDLRLALTYAIDKSRWEDRSYGPINAQSWAYGSDLKKYDYNFNHAAVNLKRVEKVPNEITLATVPAYLQVAEAVKADWEKLGVKTHIVVAAEPTSDFMALVIAQQIPIDPDQYNLWHSTQASNLTGIDNPRIDKLLEDGRKTIDTAARKTIYQDFQKYLLDEVPAVFLFHPASYTIVRK